MISLLPWTFTIMLQLAQLINGNETTKSEKAVNPAVYLTMLQMLQKTLLDMYQDAMTNTEPSTNPDTTNYNEVLQKFKLAINTHSPNTIDENLKINSFNYLSSSAMPQSVYSPSALSAPTLVPTVFSNGKVGMTPLRNSVMQFGGIPTYASTYSTLPNYQVNGGLNTYPPTLYNINSNFGLDANNYQSGNSIEPTQHRPFESAFGSSGYEMFENGFGGRNMFSKYSAVGSTSDFIPSYLIPPSKLPNLGEFLWNPNSRKPRQIFHSSASPTTNRFVRNNIKNRFLPNSNKYLKTIRKPVTRYAPSYQFLKSEQPKVKVVLVKS